MSIKLSLTYEEQLEDSNWKSLRKLIINRDHCKCKMCGQEMDEMHDLDVHHRYYIFGKYAWQYPHEALITLCRDCHELIHHTISPLIYCVKGEKLVRMNFTPCSRCFGAGWFREYKHIQGGICFRCKGARYEELIDNKKNIDADLFISDEIEEFDLLNPELSDKECEEIYQKANDYAKGNNGIEANFNLARYLFLKAALNGHAKAQNNYARLLSMAKIVMGVYCNGNSPEAIFRFTVYSAMKGIYQAQSSLKTILHEGKIICRNDTLAEKWGNLADKNMNKVIADIVEKILDANNEDEAEYIFNTLTPIEKEIVLETLKSIYEESNYKGNTKSPF